MGTYVSKPVCDKESVDEELNHLKCGSSSMQGWRTAQEVCFSNILSYRIVFIHNNLVPTLVLRYSCLQFISYSDHNSQSHLLIRNGLLCCALT